MKNKFISLFLCSIWIFGGGSCGTAEAENTLLPDPSPGTGYFSGVWVTSVASHVLDSRDNICQCVETCARYGIHPVFVVVWNGGYTHYPSRDYCRAGCIMLSCFLRTIRSTL